ncbi:MAG: hypothetical protein HQL16_05715 [Candidatus Omnitrophica bacterium]|nr:hypothetical protein [Candidatus Omnitrophota bacterium]
MAKNDIRSRTITFLAAQSIILGVIMLVFIVLASVLFVKNATRWTLKTIEDDVLMFVQQTARMGEIPKRGDLGEHTFFILNQDGKYVLPRLSHSDEDARLWQEYELKLIYEMQKRRDGWIYYPERFGIDEGQHVIRYIYLEKQGWIVAAEGYLPGAWNMLKGFLTPKLFLGLFLVVCLAYGLMLLNAFWHFRKMMKAILRSQENNFITVPNAVKSLAPEPVFHKAEDRPLSDGMIRSAGDRALPKTRVERERAYEEAPPLSRQEPESPDQGLEFSHVETNMVSEKKEIEQFTPRQLDNVKGSTIDTMDIRSPLLKKVIEEMRGKK